MVPDDHRRMTATWGYQEMTADAALLQLSAENVQYGDLIIKKVKSSYRKWPESSIKNSDYNSLMPSFANSSGTSPPGSSLVNKQ